MICAGSCASDRRYLDLSFNPVSKYYAAPRQVKASGGVFIIDDFGCQHAPPYLTLHTGKKFRIPFDTLVIFCTNIEPRKLADEAFLRRMRNKIYVGDPTTERYMLTFQISCRSAAARVATGAVAGRQGVSRDRGVAAVTATLLASWQA